MYTHHGERDNIYGNFYKEMRVDVYMGDAQKSVCLGIEIKARWAVDLIVTGRFPFPVRNG